MFTVGRQLDTASHPFNENDTPEVVLVTPHIDEAYVELRRQYRMLKGTHLVHISDASGEFTSLALEDYRASIDVDNLGHAVKIARETHKNFSVWETIAGNFDFIRLTENGPELLGRYYMAEGEQPGTLRKLALVLDENRVRVPDETDPNEWIPKSRVTGSSAKVLARFGHHTDAQADFCIEVAAVESYVTDGGVIDVALGERIRDARTFVPSDTTSLTAMTTLVRIENDILTSLLSRYEKA